MKQKYISCFTALLMGVSLIPASGFYSDLSVVNAADQQKTGNVDGYDYELWNQNGSGNVSMDLGSNGAFSCSWSNIENCLFRTGKKLGSTKKFQDYGNISINYDVDYQPMGNSYMCVYGWTQKPTVEYYIVEAWGDWRPPGEAQSLGTITSDGNTYDIYKSMRYNQPSINGTETFPQYWSVKKTNPAQVNQMKNLKGTISVSDHFKAWEKAGLEMGNMYEVALNIEGYRSSGKADVKKNELIMGDIPSTTTTTTKSPSTQVTTKQTASNPGTPSSGNYMEEARKNFTPNVPADVKSGDKGTMKKITYFSKKANRDKPANVWLPPNYSESKKYPVLYMNHGIMGGENDMTSGWGIREMASNLIEKGEVQPFIIVFPQMYTDPNSATASGIDQKSAVGYDNFLYDLTESLMPYMAEHYSVAEGRENTAIAGFSMGGRESLYIGMKAADKIGYVCASSPAPGIVPAQDMFMSHPGNMTEAEFKYGATKPYILMIGGGTADSVVGTFPKQYHELYDKNGEDNIWFEVQGAGHDASVGTPLFYNFFRNLFKASGNVEQPPVTTTTTKVTTTTTKATTTTTKATTKVTTTTPKVTTTTTKGTSTDVKGDVDGNGIVTATDVVKLMQAMVGKVTLSPEGMSNGDLNKDGKLSIIDVIMLKNLLLS